MRNINSLTMLGHVTTQEHLGLPNRLPTHVLRGKAADSIIARRGAAMKTVAAQITHDEARIAHHEFWERGEMFEAFVDGRNKTLMRHEADGEIQPGDKVTVVELSSRNETESYQRPYTGRKVEMRVTFARTIREHIFWKGAVLISVEKI